MIKRKIVGDSLKWGMDDTLHCLPVLSNIYSTPVHPQNVIFFSLIFSPAAALAFNLLPRFTVRIIIYPSSREVFLRPKCNITIFIQTPKEKHVK